MSHVDEGALHAYLDGALDEYPSAEAERIRDHVDGCAECAARLEAERTIRSDAHAMLSLADPHVEAPSFEELRAYVQRTRRQRRGISRLQRLGWAASVVVAVGAGWMLREGQLQTRALDIGQSGPAATAPQREVTAPPQRDVTAAPREADGVGARPGAEARRAAIEAEVASEVAEIQVRAAAVDADAGTTLGRPMDSMDVLEESLFAANVMKADDSATTGGSGAVEDAMTGVAAELPSAAVADVVAAAAEPDAPPLDSTPPGVTAAGARALEPAAATAQIRARTTEVVALSAAAAADALEESRREQAPSTKDQAPVEPLLSVPGHEVVDVTNLGEGTTPWGVRVRQQMTDGPAFEVFHLEPGIDPSILPALEDGVGEARTETSFGWILVRGGLPRDELAELLERLLPEGS